MSQLIFLSRMYSCENPTSRGEEGRKNVEKGRAREDDDGSEAEGEGRRERERV